MQSSSKSARLSVWLRRWAPTVLLVCAVALESESLFGADRTSGPLRAVYEFFCGPTTTSHWYSIHFLIRKSCHVMGYGLIAAAIFRSLWLTLSQPLHNSKQPVASSKLQIKCSLLAILSTVLLAAADEFHQAFIPNRTGTVSDVMIDSAGAAGALLLVWLGMSVWGQTEIA